MALIDKLMTPDVGEGEERMSAHAFGHALVIWGAGWPGKTDAQVRQGIINRFNLEASDLAQLDAWKTAHDALSATAAALYRMDTVACVELVAGGLMDKNELATKLGL